LLLHQRHAPSAELRRLQDGQDAGKAYRAGYMETHSCRKHAHLYDLPAEL
ncbi:MAG: hypothetical protein HXO45_10505, partial [Prevotella sp.]|nr:hypothetical protein [Prevotella sp.]